MIICFSGTGNSRRVADALQDALGGELLRLPPGHMLNPQKINLHIYDSDVIWVMPCHCWRLPLTVDKVINRANIAMHGDVTHHLVMTCGDDIGYADRWWRSKIAARGWKAGYTFSVQMPNSYTCLKGFDVDSPEVAQAKLDAMPARIEQIVQALTDTEKKTGSHTDVVRGKWPLTKTYVVAPLFFRFFSSTKPFHATSDCTGCGRCSRNCPITTISMVDGKPQWGKECTMCLRCYHCCPNHAVAYGNATIGKGQYICPGYPIKP